MDIATIEQIKFATAVIIIAILLVGGAFILAIVLELRRAAAQPTFTPRTPGVQDPNAEHITNITIYSDGMTVTTKQREYAVSVADGQLKLKPLE